MTQRVVLAAFMRDLAAAISSVVPADIDVGVVGDWLVFATRHGLDGWEFGHGLDDGVQVREVAGRVKGALNALQEAVSRHTTEPWPERTRRNAQGNVWLSEPVVTFTASRVHAAYGLPAPFAVGQDPRRWSGDTILSLPVVEWRAPP
jgi:hypothetical protein